MASKTVKPAARRHPAAPEAWETAIAPWAPPADLIAQFTTPVSVDGYESFPELQAEVQQLREEARAALPLLDMLEENDIEGADDLATIIKKATKFDAINDHLDNLSTAVAAAIDEHFKGDLATLVGNKFNDILADFTTELEI